jgi:hypothetical protein
VTNVRITVHGKIEQGSERIPAGAVLVPEPLYVLVNNAIIQGVGYSLVMRKQLDYGLE